VNQSFDPRAGLVVVPVEIQGPRRTGILHLALDTGATTTLINVGALVVLGYDPALTQDRVEVTTGSGVEYVARLPLQRLTALGCSRENLPVLSHTLPPSATVDGLLGLDFLRGGRLEMDFRAGIVRFDP
jgi:predicted aspartyl protease